MDELERLARTADRAQTRADETRHALHARIVTEIEAGATQADVARRSGRTRETIRKVMLAAAKRNR